MRTNGIESVLAIETNLVVAYDVEDGCDSVKLSNEMLSEGWFNDSGEWEILIWENGEEIKLTFAFSMVWLLTLDVVFTSKRRRQLSTGKM